MRKAEREIYHYMKDKGLKSIPDITRAINKDRIAANDNTVFDSTISRAMAAMKVLGWVTFTGIKQVDSGYYARKSNVKQFIITDKYTEEAMKPRAEEELVSEKMSKRYTIEDIRRCTELYEDNFAVKEITEITGVGATSINRWIEEAGLKSRAHIKKRGAKKTEANKIPQYKPFQVTFIDGHEHKIGDKGLAFRWNKKEWINSEKTAQVVKDKLWEDRANKIDIWWDTPRNVR